MFNEKMNVWDLKGAAPFYLAILVCEVFDIAKATYSFKKGKKVTNKLSLNLNLSLIKI